MGAACGSAQSDEEPAEAELRSEDDGARERAGWEDLEEREEMHAFVLRLLEQGVDPAIVAA